MFSGVQLRPIGFSQMDLLVLHSQTYNRNINKYSIESPIFIINKLVRVIENACMVVDSLTEYMSPPHHVHYWMWSSHNMSQRCSPSNLY